MSTATTLNMIKAQMVIQSCKTFKQLEAANQYIALVVRDAYWRAEAKKRDMNNWFEAEEINKVLTRLYNEQIEKVRNQ